MKKGKPAILTKAPPKSHSALRKKDVIRVLGFDVGKANPAWAIVDVPKQGAPKAVAFSAARSKINNFSSNGFIEKSKEKSRTMLVHTKSFSGQVQDFNIQTDMLIDDYVPDFVVIERFQNRGFGKQGGEASEFCGVIVGVLSSRFASRKQPFELIAAGTWKTQFNNKFSMPMQGSEAQNAKALEAVYKKTFSPHVTDAMLMAIYSGMRLHGMVPFESFRLEWIKEIMQ
jgi:hypothetical protein